MKKFSAATYAFFIALFVAAMFFSSRINFSALVGVQNQFFTLSQFFGPVAGGILGSLPGAGIVLAAAASNLALGIFGGSNSLDIVTVLRLLPMVFAAYYFGTKRKDSSVLISVAAIAVFLLHPVGKQVWFYALFWTVPIVASFFKKSLLARSLGATFTAHAVGGAIWIWTVPMTTQMWVALIPVVIVERLMFASGIAVSFVAANTLLAGIESKVPFIHVDVRYIFSKNLLRHL